MIHIAKCISRVNRPLKTPLCVSSEGIWVVRRRFIGTSTITKMAASNNQIKDDEPNFPPMLSP